MTTSLVFLEKGSIFIQLGRIVKSGKIIIRTNNNILVVDHKFISSNFESIPVNGLKGKYQITIDLGNELIKKSIII